MTRTPLRTCPADQLVCSEPTCIESCCAVLRQFKSPAEIEARAERDARMARVDASIAKQLQGSMEHNARMVNRLKKFIGHDFHDEICVAAVNAIEAIIKDEEPTW